MNVHELSMIKQMEEAAAAGEEIVKWNISMHVFAQLRRLDIIIWVPGGAYAFGSPAFMKDGVEGVVGVTEREMTALREGKA